jgi:hypothetical protein
LSCDGKYGEGKRTYELRMESKSAGSEVSVGVAAAAATMAGHGFFEGSSD